MKRATLAPVAALPTGAHPAIPAITAPRISHEPSRSSSTSTLRRGHLARATRRLPSRAHIERISRPSSLVLVGYEKALPVLLGFGLGLGLGFGLGLGLGLGLRLGLGLGLVSAITSKVRVRAGAS